MMTFLAQVTEAGPSVQSMIEGLKAMASNLPTLILFTPFFGLLILALVPASQVKWIRYFTLLMTLVTTLEIVNLMVNYKFQLPGIQMGIKVPWFPTIGAYYMVGVDGISIAFLMLTGIIFVAAALGSWNIKDRVKEYSILFLLLECSIIGVFIALDYFLFFIVWELMLVPMYFLIGIWGGPRRIYAAIKFFLFTLAGSVALLLGILALYWKSGLNTFDIIQLAGQARALPLAVQAPLFFAFFFGFAVKVPIVPLHTWLPDAHVEAPTPISVILAGILLKTGGYGLYRFAYFSFPDAAKEYAIWIAVIGVVSIVYGALVAMDQEDLKTLIAMASVSHMGYVVFGLATLRPEGFSAGIFQMVSHGFVSGMLFLLVGVIYDRAHTRGVNDFGGLGSIMPAYFAIFTLAGLANLALPGLSGFWGEVLAYMGAFRNYDYIWNGMYTFRVLAFIAAPAIVVTAGYTLWTLQRLFMGPMNEAWRNLKDLESREVLSLAVLGVFVVVLGIMPSLLTRVYDDSMMQILRIIVR